MLLGLVWVGHPLYLLAIIVGARESGEIGPGNP